MSRRIDSRYLLAAITVFLWGCPIDDAHFAPTGSSASSSSGEGSSSSGGGAGGNGGVAGMGGASVSSSSSGMGGSGGMGGGPMPPLVMLSVGVTGGITSTFKSGMGWSPAVAVPDAKSDMPPGFGIIPGKSKGVAMIRSTADGAVYPVKYLSWNAMSGFGTATNLNATMATTRANPTVITGVDAIHISFIGLGVDHNYYYAAYDGTAFGPNYEKVKDLVGGTTSSGHCAPGLVLLGTDVLLLNPGELDESLYDRTRVAGAWNAGHDHQTTNMSFDVDDIAPAIATRSMEPKVIAVITKKNVANKPLYFIRRDMGTWTFPAAISNTNSIEPVLLRLPNDDVLLVYRDYLAKDLYWSRFNGTSWSAVQPVGNNVTAQSRPALALGAGDAEAELLFVDLNGQAHHSRFQGGAFSAPIVISDAMGFLGIAAATNL